MSEPAPTEAQSGVARGVERLKRWAASAWQKAGPLALVGLLVLGFALGYWLAPRRAAALQPDGERKEAAPAAKKASMWTCSMHPQIRQPRPGRCPICAMDLIPLAEEPQEEEAAAASPRRFVTTEAARKLMRIETSPVERKFVAATVRMVGKVDYDETRLAYITAWVGGRIDRLYVDFTGISVRPGDHMVYLYSPELRTGQEEFLIAWRHWQAAKQGGDADNIASAQAILDATRKKLELWGILPAQIERLQKSGRGEDHMTIYSPVGGIVIHKNAQEGMYVQTGSRIYTIADLSQVWVKLDAYESDLLWLRYGQDVAFTTEAYPGEEFRGRIAFIDPVLHARTRTVKVRVDVANPAGKLKPEMFVRAVVEARVAAGGRVMAPDLSGKWMCPMHPSVVKEDADNCDLCEMPLVTTESLGFVPVHEAESAKPLVIPASAPLITGTRAVVYVEAPDAERPTFGGREIVLGPRAGDYYLVRRGLAEGERVVTRGNFKIDSALQILARPSMMAPEAGTPATAPPPKVGPPPEKGAPVAAVEAPDAFKAQLAKVLDGYFAAQAALAADELKAAIAAVQRAAKAVAAVDMQALPPEAHAAWMRELPSLQKALSDIEGAKDITAARSGFSLFSDEMARLVRMFSLAAQRPVHVLQCPMAFNNRGATWLQLDTEVRNPYFGAAMFRCGDVRETIGAPSAGDKGARHEHP